VQIVIKNFRWNDQTGLPVEVYSEEDVEEKSEEVFRHDWRAYPNLPSPVYAS
jgi:type I restriction enzyme R subunit